MSRSPLRVVLPAAVLLLVAGFAVGLVISGRLDLTTSSSAAARDVLDETAAPQVDVATPAGAAVAAPALPNLSAIAERALQVSVNISSTNIVRVDPYVQFLWGNQVRAQQSLGSGVVVSSDGLILTNRHVLGDQVRAIRVTLPDGREMPAALVGMDPVSDLAVIKIDETNLQTIPWGDSSQLRVAEWVLAVGNPFQLSGTVTLGIVSTVSRSGDQVGTVQDFIQTDAAINPGNSGGALINARGELVGINTMIYSETGGYQGIGFAIPSNPARQIMSELVEHGVVSWGSIGAMTLITIDRDTALYRRLPATGAYVRDIARNAEAYRVGLEPGDIITSINGQAVTSADQIYRAIPRQKIGATVVLNVVKADGRQAEIQVPVVARQTQQPRRR